MPEELKITTSDIIVLMDEYPSIKEDMKEKILTWTSSKLDATHHSKHEEILRNIYNLLAISSICGGEKLLKNGLISFRNDNGKIFQKLTKKYEFNKEQFLMEGCVTIADNTGSYLRVSDAFLGDSRKLFDFKKLVLNAITSADETIIINAKIMQNKVEHLLNILR